MISKNDGSIVSIDGSKLELSETRAMLSNHDENDHSDEINLGDLIKVLKLHRLLIATVTTLVFTIALLYTLSIVPTYRAEATIKIDREADKIVSFDVYEQKAIDQNFYQTQYDILKSRKLASRVIEQLGLEDHFNQPKLEESFISEQIDAIKAFFTEDLLSIFNEQKVEEDNLFSIADDELKGANNGFEGQLAERPVELSFLEHLTITPAKKSNIVHIYYESAEPELATDIVNALVENYIQLNLESRSDSTVYAKEFLTGQLAIIKSKLQRSEEDLVAYAKKKKIINTDDNKSIISSELQALSAAYTEAQTELISAESKYRKKGKSSGAMHIMDNPVIEKLKEKKVTLHSKYTELAQVYKPAYPIMIEIKNQIVSIDKQINREILFIKHTSSNDLETNYLAAKDKAQKLKVHLNKKKAEMMNLQDKSIGYMSLNREVETNRELYNGLLQRVKEVGVAGGIVSNNVSLLDPAFIPYKKYKPNTGRNLAIGLLLGLMLGIAIAFLTENLNDTVKTAEDVEKLTGLPVIGFFPFTKARSGKHPLLIHDKPFSPAGEAFRSLSFDLEYATEKGVPKLLHLTSSTPNEGKSSSSINLATVIAQSGKRVVVIDADLRKPSLHEYMDMGNDNGLTDVLVGKSSLEDALQTTEVPGMSILSAGVIPSNPVMLLASQSMIDLLDKLADNFDQVIIDSPPLLGMADALILSNRAHATIFVVASEQCKKAVISNALKRLDRSYGIVAGVLLTKVKTTKTHYYHQDNYYSYSKDGDIGVEMTPVQKIS